MTLLEQLRAAAKIKGVKNGIMPFDVIIENWEATGLSEETKDSLCHDAESQMKKARW